MKHIIIQIESIMKYPPSMSLMLMLRDMGEEVILLSSSVDQADNDYCEQIGVKAVDLGYGYTPKDNPAVKLGKIPLINAKIKRKLKQYYNDDSCIWIMTSISLKFIGNALDNKRYIMYMYELSQEIRYYPAFSIPKVPLEKLFKNAATVIECEYNRAHIARAWFGLDNLPYVMPNKPYIKNTFNPHMEITDEEARKTIDTIKGRKIILYQGIIDPERPLEQFIHAVEELGDEYALLVMSGNLELIKGKEGKNTYTLPFVNPPQHLEITSWAHIGILTYVPVRGATTSPLNAVYCAPNKIYEYAMFGIPMLGNDIPGLTTLFEREDIGRAFKEFTSDDIKSTIADIEDNYSHMSKKSMEYYGKTDNHSLLKEIVGNIR